MCCLFEIQPPKITKNALTGDWSFSQFYHQLISTIQRTFNEQQRYVMFSFEFRNGRTTSTWWSHKSFDFSVHKTLNFLRKIVNKCLRFVGQKINLLICYHLTTHHSTPLEFSSEIWYCNELVLWKCVCIAWYDQCLCSHAM